MPNTRKNRVAAPSSRTLHAREPSSARELAAHVLAQAERRRAYVDLLLRASLRESHLGSRDRAFVSELVRGSVRWRLYLRWVLKRRYHGDYLRAPLELRAILEVAAYELFFHLSTPAYAIVSEAVNAARTRGGESWARRVNAILRRLERTRTTRPMPANKTSARGLAIIHSHPEWLVKRWLARYGVEETVALLQANNRPAALIVRVNTARFSERAVVENLRAGGVQVEKISGFPGYLRLEKLPAGVEDLRLFREGAFVPQDPSASLPIALLSIQPGEKVWDVCAAPGGKTTAIAQILRKSSGGVIASDVRPHRIQLVRQAAGRLGLDNIRYVCGDARRLPFRFHYKVLVDAPCSGTGVLRRRVDARWQHHEEDVPKLQRKQIEILDAIADNIPKHGVLVYSTCTLEQEEDEAVVEAFLRKHPEFVVEHAGAFVDQGLTTAEGFVRTFPHRHDLDGTFAARLVRVK